jgi:hypothetical protein
MHSLLQQPAQKKPRATKPGGRRMPELLCKMSTLGTAARRAVGMLGAALVAGLAWSSVAQAQTFPERNLTLIVPFALPIAMENMEKFGVPQKIVSFVIPTGYTFNLDGTTLYLSLASVFVAQAAGIHMPIGAQIIMGLTLMLTSK